MSDEQPIRVFYTDEHGVEHEVPVVDGVVTMPSNRRRTTMATNGTGGAMSSAADLVLQYSLRADDGQPLAAPSPRSQDACTECHRSTGHKLDCSRRPDRPVRVTARRESADMDPLNPRESDRLLWAMKAIGARARGDWEAERQALDATIILDRRRDDADG